MTRVTHSSADRAGEGQVPTEGSLAFDAHRRHALMSALAGVGVGGAADLGLLGVLKLAALGDGEEIHTCLGEGHAVMTGVL